LIRRSFPQRGACGGANALEDDDILAVLHAWFAAQPSAPFVRQRERRAHERRSRFRRRAGDDNCTHQIRLLASAYGKPRGY
jgi:hypothetical protein